MSEILFFLLVENMHGALTAIRGIVVDMYFGEKTPSIYDAVEVSEPNSTGEKVIIEVLQQLED